MSALVIFPDAEDVVGTWLQTELAEHGRTRTVSAMAPDDFNRANPERAEYIRIQLVDSQPAGVTLRDFAFIIECYADTATAAIATAQVCSALFVAAPRIAGSPIYETPQASGPVPLPDPRTALSRYTQNVTVRLRGAVI